MSIITGVLFLRWTYAPRPGILPIWWALWITSILFNQMAFRLTFRADTVDELLDSSLVTFVSDGLELPLGIAAIAVVSTLQTWQSEKRRRTEGISSSLGGLTP